MARINLIDGNNQFFIKAPKALSMANLTESCLSLHNGYDVVYWIFDGLDSRKPRRDIYPEYKNTSARKAQKQDMTKYELLKQFKHQELPKHGGCIVIEIPFTEADDIIRKLVTLLANGENQITISSNDADILELTKYKGVIQPQARLPNFCSAPEHIPIYKTLVGDSSDNIKGLKGFGEKAWAALSEADLKTLTHHIVGNYETLTTDLDDAKLTVKIRDNWDQVRMWYSIVNFIDFDATLLEKHWKIYPKARPNIQAQNLTMDGI